MIKYGVRLRLTCRVGYAEAEGNRAARSPRYRRFATAAEAIRFAVEEMPALRTLGACMQVGDEHFDRDDICRLYESSEYQLRRGRFGDG